MARPVGSVNKGSEEYARKYETLVEQYGDPMIVLFKLTRSRTQSIKLQAARELMQYRYPKLAAAQVEAQAAAQMVMMWEDTLEIGPPDLSELQHPDIIGKAVTVDE